MYLVLGRMAFIKINFQKKISKNKAPKSFQQQVFYLENWDLKNPIYDFKFPFYPSTLFKLRAISCSSSIVDMENVVSINSGDLV